MFPFGKTPSKSSNQASGAAAGKPSNQTEILIRMLLKQASTNPSAAKDFLASATGDYFREKANKGDPFYYLAFKNLETAASLAPADPSSAENSSSASSFDPSSAVLAGEGGLFDSQTQFDGHKE